MSDILDLLINQSPTLGGLAALFWVLAVRLRAIEKEQESAKEDRSVLIASVHSLEIKVTELSARTDRLESWVESISSKVEGLREDVVDMRERMTHIEALVNGKSGKKAA